MGVATFCSCAHPPSSHTTFSNLEVKVAVGPGPVHKDWTWLTGLGWWGNGAAGIVWVSLQGSPGEEKQTTVGFHLPGFCSPTGSTMHTGSHILHILHSWGWSGKSTPKSKIYLLSF